MKAQKIMEAQLVVSRRAAVYGSSLERRPNRDPAVLARQ